MKRGQISIFIILVVIIILTLVGIFYFNTKKSDNNNQNFSKIGITSQAEIIQESAKDCLEQSTIESLTVIGLQGGYNTKPEKFFDLGWSFIPYQYYEGDLLAPNKEEIEKQLKNYINHDIQNCINSLNFPDFEVTYKNSNTQVNIKDNQVEFIINADLILLKDELTANYKLENFPIIIDSQLNDMIEISNQIGKQLTTEPFMICSSCLSELAEQKNLYIDIMDFSDDTHSLVAITTEKATIPILFRFLNKYTQEEIDKYLDELGRGEPPKEPGVV